MEEITIEQALDNITLIVEDFKGTKKEHIILAQCLAIIKAKCIDSPKKG